MIRADNDVAMAERYCKFVYNINRTDSDSITSICCGFVVLFADYYKADH